VVVRRDLPFGILVAQTVHAAGETALPGGVPSGTRAVALAAKNEQHLLKIANQLRSRLISFKVIYEPDSPWNGAAMAIGLYPTQNRKPIKRALSRLPLIKEKKYV